MVNAISACGCPCSGGGCHTGGSTLYVSVDMPAWDWTSAGAQITNCSCASGGCSYDGDTPDPTTFTSPAFVASGSIERITAANAGDGILPCSGTYSCCSYGSMPYYEEGWSPCFPQGGSPSCLGEPKSSIGEVVIHDIPACGGWDCEFVGVAAIHVSSFLQIHHIPEYTDVDTYLIKFWIQVGYNSMCPIYTNDCTCDGIPCSCCFQPWYQPPSTFYKEFSWDGMGEYSSIFVDGNWGGDLAFCVNDCSTGGCNEPMAVVTNGSKTQIFRGENAREMFDSVSYIPFTISREEIL